MDCHHPQLIAAAAIHVAPHLAATAPHLRQKGGQRYSACRPERLCKAEEVIKRFVHRRAKPAAEFLSCLD